MPTTSPRRLNSGPPELPGLTATSVWMKGTKVSSGSERPLALTMPAVIVFSKPNGEPIAATHSPTLSFAELPSFTVGRPVASILSSATSVRSVGADHLGLELALASVRLDGDFVGARDHVRVGEDVAVLADDEARAEAHALARSALATAGTALGRVRHEAAKELGQRILGARGAGAATRLIPCRLRLALGDHVDHGGTLFLHQGGEVGQVGGASAGGGLGCLL